MNAGIKSDLHSPPKLRMLRANPPGGLTRLRDSTVTEYSSGGIEPVEPHFHTIGGFGFYSSELASAKADVKPAGAIIKLHECFFGARLNFRASPSTNVGFDTLTTCLEAFPPSC